MENELRSASPEVEWRFRLRQGLSLAHGDRDELREVIRQIVANAVDALGGAPGIIEIETGDCELSAARTARDFPDDDLPPGRYVTLTVRDTGCGMSPDVLRRIFDPFFTTKFTGRGLGLPAAQGIVRAHRGAIRVESSPGSGTLVEIVLPAC
jgi:signal transduction histidine kinase